MILLFYSEVDATPAFLVQFVSFFLKALHSSLELFLRNLFQKLWRPSRTFSSHVGLVSCVICIRAVDASSAAYMLLKRAYILSANYKILDKRCTDNIVDEAVGMMLRGSLRASDSTIQALLFGSQDWTSGDFSGDQLSTHG